MGGQVVLVIFGLSRALEILLAKLTVTGSVGYGQHTIRLVPQGWQDAAPGTCGGCVKFGENGAQILVEHKVSLSESPSKLE